MNRQARRQQDKNFKKNVETINKLTPAQTKLVDLVAEEKAIKINNKFIGSFMALLDRSMSAALIEFGIDYEEIDGIQENMSSLLLEDTEKTHKLEKECIDLTKIEMEVKGAIEGLLGVGDTKKQDIENLIYKFPKLSKSMLLNAYGKTRREMGLTENRISKETVYEYLDGFAYNTECKNAVTRLMGKFSFTENTAKTYYSKWKKQYMAEKIVTDPIAPNVQVVKKVVVTRAIEENAKKIIEAVKERQCIKPVIKDSLTTESLSEHWGEVVQASTIKNEEEVEMKGLKIVESNVVVRKTIKVEGENGAYDADTIDGVVLSKNGMVISFKNSKELDEFYNEFKSVFALTV